ncbi:subtilisin family serine protease [Hamadaea flava]|uniref:S8 family serine peptidase n=1 Tax=Hamadaea flava TaxID=1742688 RepID=A0ABV8LVQ4_9ACTN|nr:S8 family serine peptidase [Hamadaea flava]MCP2329189.1 subtilisin family serine protease [Hamadaea flava]
MSRKLLRRLSLPVAVALLTTVGAVASAPVAATAAASTATVDPAVRADLAAAGQATFLVRLKGSVDLSDANKQRTHAGKAKAAYRALTEHAENSQRGLREQLDKAKAKYTSFWIADEVRVTGDAAVLAAIAARSDVEAITVEKVFQLPDTAAVDATASTQAVEWGIDRIRAPQVWSEYGTTGEGVVVANIDSGVQFDHPALAAAYRGTLGAGRYSHDYNWYDPAGICPTAAPCDNAGHGTHTMGTMVGAGGIGVAPGAKWIAAKGCETDSCSESSLLLAGQWILAPTDSTGANPRPDLAPNIVNNSWGGGQNDLWYADMIAAWRAAGIFPVFSAGNSGPACGTANSPGDNADAYAVGSFTSANTISSFSSRGPSVAGLAKPNIAAPGSNIRSAYPGDGYTAMNGTSMAAPHVAGTIALLWSAAPSLVGDLTRTTELLDSTAVDTANLTCGGTAAKNNVFGEGRLDAYAAVGAAPRGEVGSATGTVTDPASGDPLPGVTVTATSSDTTRSVRTLADGSYQIYLPVGEYTVTAHLYGRADAQATGVAVTANTQSRRDFALAAAPQHAVSGRVYDVLGRPLAGAAVRVSGTPLDEATTDDQGRYRFAAVAEGAYDVVASPAAPVLCNAPMSRSLTVDADAALDFALPNRTDRYGYTCTPSRVDWVDAHDRLPLKGDEDVATVALPFPVTFYGVERTTAYVTTNGLVNFAEPRLGDYANTILPGLGNPNGVVAAFWDDLIIDDRAKVQTALLGRTGDRRFVVEWDDALLASDGRTRISAEAVFAENGDITLQYRQLGGNAAARGGGATIGLENVAGTDGLRYAYNEVVLERDQAITFTAPLGVTSAKDATDPTGPSEAQTAQAARRLDAAETTADTDATAAATTTGMKATGLVETVRGVTATSALPGGDLLVVHSGGSVARMTAAGDTVWRRGTTSLHTDWQVSPVRPWQIEPYSARIYLGYGPLSTLEPQSYAVGDVTGDGIPEVAFLAEVGASPYRPFTKPGSALNTGTFLTVLNGQTGATQWSTLLPAAYQVAIADGTLVATVIAGSNTQTPAAQQTELHGWRFTPGMTVDREWTVSTGSRTAVFTTLDAAGPGQVAAGWIESYRNATVVSHTLLVDSVSGAVRWDVTNPAYARFLRADPSRSRLVALEQRIGLDGVTVASGRYDLVTYDLATGARTLRSSRVNALPTNLVVADVAGSAAPEYVVNETFFDGTMFVNTTQTRALDGTDGSSEIWARTVKRTGSAGDGPISLGLTTSGRTVVAGQWEPRGLGTSANRTGDRVTSVVAMDGPNGTVRWSTTGDVGQPLVMTAQAGEVVAIAQNQTLYRYSAGGGQVTQATPLMGDLVTAVPADVNGDGVTDLVVGGESRGVFALDGASLGTSAAAAENPVVLWRQVTAGPVHQLQLADVTGDGVPEVVVAATDAAQVLDPRSGRVRTTIAGDYVWTVTAADLDGKAGAELVVPTDALRAYSSSGKRLWTQRPADGVRLSNAVVADGAVLASYNTVGGIDLSAPAVGGIAVDGDSGNVRWTVTPSAVDGRTIRGAQLWQGVAAAPTLTLSEGRSVAFTWLTAPAGAVTGPTQVDLMDARNGSVVQTFTDGGTFTHHAYASGPAGLLQIRSAAFTLVTPDGTVYHRNQLPVPYSGGFARGVGGQSLVVTGNEAGVTVWDASVLTGPANYPATLASDSTYMTGNVVIADLTGDGVDEIIGLNQDMIGLDSVTEMSGGGLYQAGNEPHGMVVYALS